MIPTFGCHRYCHFMVNLQISTDKQMEWQLFCLFFSFKTYLWNNIDFILNKLKGSLKSNFNPNRLWVITHLYSICCRLGITLIIRDLSLGISSFSSACVYKHSSARKSLCVLLSTGIFFRLHLFLDNSCILNVSLKNKWCQKKENNSEFLTINSLFLFSPSTNDHLLKADEPQCRTIQYSCRQTVIKWPIYKKIK